MLIDITYNLPIKEESGNLRAKRLSRYPLSSRFARGCGWVMELSTSSESPTIHVRLCLNNLTNQESRREHSRMHYAHPPPKKEGSRQIPMIPMTFQRQASPGLPWAKN